MIALFTVETRANESEEWSDGGIPEEGIDPPTYDSPGAAIDDCIDGVEDRFEFRVIDAAGVCVCQGRYGPSPFTE
jgi:hypothetical protein